MDTMMYSKRMALFGRKYTTRFRLIFLTFVAGVLFISIDLWIPKTILKNEGGERDLWGVAQQSAELDVLQDVQHIALQVGAFEEPDVLQDVQNKIKRLEELKENLERRKKELSVKVIGKKKREKKKTKDTPKTPDEPPNKNSKQKRTSNCTSYENDANIPKTVIPFMLGGGISVSKSDITFATHLSVSRLDMLEEVMKHWSGPLSVAIVATPDTAAQLTTALDHIRSFSQGRVDLHVVGSTSRYYPANYLRNVALNNTRTDFVFLSDVDFVPMYGAHTRIKTAINNGLLDDLVTKRALVIPAFEFLMRGSTYPRTKQDLINLWQENKALPFHYHLKPAHGPTDFGKWKNTSEPYVIKWKQYFEPYIVMKTAEAPPYHEGFVGREFNKISHIMEVQARRFQFMVLPNTFTIHLPHMKSSITRTNFKCATRLYRIFQKNLRKKFHANV